MSGTDKVSLLFNELYEEWGPLLKEFPKAPALKKGPLISH